METKEEVDISDLREGDIVYFGDLSTEFRIDDVDELPEKIDDKEVYEVYVKGHGDSTMHFKDGKSMDTGICDIMSVKMKDRTKTTKNCLWCNGTGKIT